MSRADDFHRWWTSGEIWRVAAQSKDANDLALHLGIGRETLEKGLGQLRREGHRVPHLTSLIVHAKRLGRETRHEPSLSAIDEWDEPTSPGVPDMGTAIPDLGIHAEAAAVDTDPVEEHRLKRRIGELEAANRDLMDQLLNTRNALGVAREVAEHRVEPLAFREHRSGRREAASLIALSDNHVDEHVSLESVNGLNEHNPEIARHRMARVFEGARWLTSHARQSHLVRDVILWCGGDHISGTIHEDLRETNAMSLPESIAFAQQLIGDGIRHLLEDPETETIRVVCSTGNHGRLAPGKPRIHTRNETNAETILFLALAREFGPEPRVSFDLPTGVFTYFEVYDKTIRASHGDHLKYGGALGGLTNPINRAVARMNMARRADLDLFGHWHSYQDCGNWIVNGATVGYGTFSEWIHAPFERPQQAWALLDSKRWRSLSAPVWCDEIDEGREAA